MNSLDFDIDDFNNFGSQFVELHGNGEASVTDTFDQSNVKVLPLHADYAPHRISDQWWQEGIKGTISSAGSGDSEWKVFDRQGLLTAIEAASNTTQSTTVCQVLVYNVLEMLFMYQLAHGMQYGIYH